MTAAIFPAYALARLVVSRPWALFAAVGAGGRARARVRAAPRRGAVRLSGRDARALPDRARCRGADAPAPSALAFAGCVVAPLVRAQLAVLFLVLALSLAALAWRASGAARGAATWSALGLGRRGRCSLVGLAVAVLSALMSTGSEQLGRRRRTSTRAACSSTASGRRCARDRDRHPAGDRGARRARAAAERVGRSAPARVRDRHRDRPSASSLLHGRQGAPTSRPTSRRLVVERNLIYLAPLLFAGTALAARAAACVRWSALARRGAFALVPRRGDADELDLVPLLRSARALDARALEPRIRTGRRAAIETRAPRRARRRRALVVGAHASLAAAAGQLARRGSSPLFVLGWNADERDLRGLRRVRRSPSS